MLNMVKTIEEFEDFIPDLDLLKKQNDLERNRYLNNIFEKELLIDIFLTHNMTANGFIIKFVKKKGMTTCAGTLIQLAKKYNIKTKSLKDAANNSQRRTCYEKTCFEKYGAKNALSKGTSSYFKRNDTVKKNYGVENVFQLNSVIEKSKKTMLSKYGVPNTVYLDSFQRNNGKISKPHEKISNFLNEKNIKHENEVKNKCCKYNKSLNKYYSPILDILIESENLVIEIYGDRWHCNKRLFKADDSINFLWKKTKELKTAREVWEFDKFRINQIKSFGYKVLIFWESEIKNLDKFEKIKKKILNSIKNTTDENNQNKINNPY